MKKVYKALMVEEEVHQKVVVKAKQKKLTVTEYITKLANSKVQKPWFVILEYYRGF